MLLQEYVVEMAESEAPMEWLRDIGVEDDYGGADASLDDAAVAVNNSSRKEVVSGVRHLDGASQNVPHGANG